MAEGVRKLLCRDYLETKPNEPRKFMQYVSEGFRKCGRCKVFIRTEDLHCPCCSQRLKRKSKGMNKWVKRID